ncbi:DEAD/DEAH box helicase [Bifidobacterium animalis]|nr:DEAD/DEAH box helicase [Bifidobacterium animalis]ANU44021.1 DEAD/DEAH box helicase [Bifidobacterium animalis subsp. animalis]PHQ54629.1 DEAD/DEAH box helicase [Bifidobacterium animalis subsp. animalis]QQQ91105.1 DEAD/DEAH box helicase [Bifidobacterium animalis]UQE64190.1 DEAD/DEAH box helicase [Bifidobacterium animalis]
MQSVAARFADRIPFELDAFQQDANEALEAGSNVLVAAPTGAGKTVVADFAIYLAQQRNVKAFYTTPIKALSNQKYHDLVDMYGADKVGLLTGDTSINSEADIVVMTTEVLRNMLYEHSTTLNALGYVILDEVHYLADRFRGPIWEEVIIHLPQSVRIIGLSATVSNVEDFADWIESVRGDTKLVVSEHRPVPLDQYVLLQKDPRTEPELFDLYRRDDMGEQTVKMNARLMNRLDELDCMEARRARADAHDRSERRRDRGSKRKFVRKPERYQPRRWAVVDELNFLGMLPAIYFVFSRNGCDEAVDQCLNAGLRLTTDEEALRIRKIVDEMIEGQLTREDLKTLHFPQFRYALEEGFAAHHAGMIALFKQIVERLFEEGLIKCVFATETLALGINMPARSVVVEKLEKYNGTGIVPLTPGEYTQLTGRAGRRGIDTIGNAIVVDHRDFKPETAVALSSKRVYPLHSSFKATFNMAVNLLNSSDYETARDTLDHSFAQWEANESAWDLEACIGKLRKAIAGYEEAMANDAGDMVELLRIRMKLSDLQKNERRRLKHEVFKSNEERSRAFRRLDAQIAQLKEQEANHPAKQSPDFKTLMKWGHRWVRETKELERLEYRYESRTSSVARQFDRICHSLEVLGYLETADENGHIDYRLTEYGQLLRRLYTERDLVLAQAITHGIFDDLNAPELAAVMSSLLYEPRRGEGGEPRRYPGGPRGRVMQAANALRDMDGQIIALCEANGLENYLQPLDFGIVDLMYNWAYGDSLSEVLEHSDMTGGDFVRTAKRIADVLQQIAVAEPYLGEGGAELAAVAHEAYERVNRGIVAYSGVD